MTELLAVCDRVIVIDNGRIVGEVRAQTPEFDLRHVLEMMHSSDGGRTRGRAMKTRPVVIVGAGLAGVSAAAALRADGFDGRLVLVGGEPHLPYDRPPLSKGICCSASRRRPTSCCTRRASTTTTTSSSCSASRSPASLAARAQGTPRLRGEPGGRPAAARAPAASPRRLNVPGDHLEGIHYLRSLDDALAIQDQLQIHGSLVVVGAGFIGAEVAAAARERGLPGDAARGRAAPARARVGRRDR